MPDAVVYCAVCARRHAPPLCGRSLFRPMSREEWRRNKLSEELLGLRCRHGIVGECYLCLHHKGVSVQRYNPFRPKRYKP